VKGRHPACLYKAATIMLERFTGEIALKMWGLKLAKGKCHAKAAVARKLVMIMRAMWRNGSEYVAGTGAAEKPAGKQAMRRRSAVAAGISPNGTKGREKPIFGSGASMAPLKAAWPI
jgi:hypothetical protein